MLDAEEEVECFGLLPSRFYDRFLESSASSLFKRNRIILFRSEPVGYENFESLNTASKINAGIECINVISDFYQTQIPLFLDGRESVTKITETNSQVINLFVDPTATTLKF